MTVEKTSSGRNEGGRITRRRLLQLAPCLAALATAGPASPVLAQTISTGSASSPLPAASQALLSVASAGDMPFRTVEEAAAACGARRGTEGRLVDPNPSPLERLLAATSLAESRLGLANWPLVDETEDVNLGHFSFPISPFNLAADDGDQQFLLFSNSQVIANFRQVDYLEMTQRRMFDRAVWAMRQGLTGTAVVEFDRPLTGQKVDRIVRLLGSYGVKTIIWGNELNDPYTPWRDNLPALFDILASANSARRRYGLNEIDLSLAGLAYWGHGEYLQKMLSTFKQLQRTRFPATPNDMPVQRVADHYYGPVDGLLQRIRMIRGVMSAEGVTQLKYDLTELGNPTLEGNQQRASDLQLAEGYIPQVGAIAIGSNQVDRISYYSLLDISPSHSVMEIANGRLVKKPSYQAVVVAAKLLARLKTLNVLEERDLVRVDGRRTDNIAFQLLWSKLSDADLWLDVPAGARIYDALGQQLNEERPGKVALRRRQLPSLGGPTRIVVMPS